MQTCWHVFVSQNKNKNSLRDLPVSKCPDEPPHLDASAAEACMHIHGCPHQAIIYLTLRRRQVDDDMEACFGRTTSAS
jgi:hypothetical protein